MSENNGADYSLLRTVSPSPKSDRRTAVVSPDAVASLHPPTTPSNLNNSSDSNVIELNVGGFRFTTSRSTLCRVPGSALESMFSGRHAVGACQSPDGRHFIDRDGTHFRHILNFLRCGSVITLPETDAAKEELAVEADFYGLEALVRVIRMPKVDVAEFLTEETRLQWEQEARLRTAFCDRVPPSDPFEGLVPLFCPDNGPGSLPLTFDPNSLNRNPDYLLIGDLRKNPKPDHANPLAVTVETLEKFKTNFNREWPNVLHRLEQVLLQEPVIIAGGSVLRALTGSEDVRTGDWWKATRASDIDMFLYCDNPEEANRIARRIYYALAADNERWAVIRCRGVINIHHMLDGMLETRVQIILRLYDSPTEVLIGFDVDCCCCAFDGRDVWLTPRCISALQSGVNVLNPLHAWPNRASYELRLAKYASRGYAVSVPGIDMCRIDYNRIHQSKLVDLKGMARFVKIATEMYCAPLCRRHIWRQQQRRMETIERPRLPAEVANLQEEALNNESADERLILVRVDHRIEVYDNATDVIVPSVFPDPQPVEWTYPGGDFPLARDSRDDAWQEILDAGEDEERPAFLKRRLVDAWDTEKRSREYLNGKMDPFELNSIYYSHAYKENATK